MSDLRPNSDDHSGSTDSGLSRRALVRTAGKAAWVAPVIVVASGAPAVAASLVNLDVTVVNVPGNSGNVTVTIRNNATTPMVLPQTVAVTFSPTSGTIAYTQGLNNPNPVTWTASPATVAATSSPVTISFTSATLLAAGATKSVQFSIVETGAGNISATVTSPPSANNNTLGGTYA